MSGGLRLRTLGMLMAVFAFVMGGVAAWLWASSNTSWQAHLNRSYIAGLRLYDALRTGGPLPDGIETSPLSAADNALANAGDFGRMSGAPTPAYVTNVSIQGYSPDLITGEILTMGIVSDDLRYSISELGGSGTYSAEQKLGEVTRLMATYCSDSFLVVRRGGPGWTRVDGQQVWGCGAGPTDMRLIAVIIAALILSFLATLIADVTSHFDRFSRALRERRRLGGPQSYSPEGPAELRDIMVAVNGYLQSERTQLSKRAEVLSGVSHDLGTPANRLRLRTALIPDDELRTKLEADIDSMTGMIDSALTYTRSELSAEEPRKISLVSFVEAIVADYQDMGAPVTLRPMEPQIAQGAASVFAAQRGQGSMRQEQSVLATARPIMLQRAVGNLIDNALKYGRRAHVALDATADTAVISVEDAGTGVTAADMDQYLAPFRRGENAKDIQGFGLGLTIVTAVAEQHGGQLTYEATPHGLRACLELRRR